jgi:hypothetical protein
MGGWQTELVSRLTASMRNRIDLEREWQRAVLQAIRELKAQGSEVAAVTIRLLPDMACPLSLADLNCDPADPALLVERLTRALQPG